MQDSKTIVLVEDSPDDVVLTRLAFEQAGIQERLIVLSNGSQAIEYLRGEGPYADREQFPVPGFLLLDLGLPRMTGFEFLVWLRQEPGLSDLPVIVLTGSLNPADAEHAYQAGANCFLLKPSSVIELAAVLNKIWMSWLERANLAQSDSNANLTITIMEKNPLQAHESEKLAA